MRVPALVALAVILAAAPACQPQPEEGSAVLLPVPDDPTVSYKIWFQVGSVNDPPGKEGLAWLTANLISRGATTENSYEAILDRLYPLASSYSVRVDREMTTFSGRTHRDNVDAYTALYTEAFLKPAFTEEDFERLRSEALNYLEKGLRYSSDEELGKAALMDAVFGGTRYAHPPEGSVAGLKAVTLDDVRGFYAAHYTAASAKPALGGGYPQGLEAQLEEAVALLPDGDASSAPAVSTEAIEGIELVLVDKPGADASISFGYPVDVRRGDADFYALWLANSWLGEHRNQSSHLYQVIRETRGMNYGDYSYIEAFPEGGQRSMPPTGVGRNHQLFQVWIRTLPNADAHFALRAAMRELKHLVDDGLTEEEFELTRAFLRKYSLHFAETTDARLGYRVDDLFYGLEEEGHLERFRRRMDELTLDEVNAAVKKHLRYENLKIAIVTGEATSLKEALVSGAPSPKSYADAKPDAVLAEDKEIEVFPVEIAEENVRVVPVDAMFQGG